VQSGRMELGRKSMGLVDHVGLQVQVQGGRVTFGYVRLTGRNTFWCFSLDLVLKKVSGKRQ